MTTNTESEVAKANSLAAEIIANRLSYKPAMLRAAIKRAFAALRTASQGECAAHPGECSIGSHGPGGANQCKHCGNEATPASASEGDE